MVYSVFVRSGQQALAVWSEAQAGNLRTVCFHYGVGAHLWQIARRTNSDDYPAVSGKGERSVIVDFAYEMQLAGRRIFGDLEADAG